MRTTLVRNILAVDHRLWHSNCQDIPKRTCWRVEDHPQPIENGLGVNESMVRAFLLRVSFGEAVTVAAAASLGFYVIDTRKG
jgi:hypothetical protein